MDFKLLYEKWNNYTDTNKLVKRIMSLLSNYGHMNTEKGICSLLDHYFESKRELIELFKKSSNYVGDMRVVLDIDMVREIDKDTVYGFVQSFLDEVDADSIILKKTDEEGKTRNDYEKHNRNTFSINDLFDNSIVDKLVNICVANNKFKPDGYTTTSFRQLDEVKYIINEFATIYSTVLPNKYSGDNYKKYHINKGQKTSRAFNKVCAYYGFDKLPQYNKLFAKYSDLISNNTRKMKFIISLNPLDYLTMSFGKSWASCHTIDRENKRNLNNSYEGQYCGGTLSYMLDKSSIVTYVLDEIPDDIVEYGKIYRNMFHFENDVLIQGRVYPQSNDGATDLYRTFRSIMQTELSKLIGLEENRWVKGEVDHVASRGVHYRDYDKFDSCNRSYPKELPDAENHLVYIGAKGICIKCGKTIDNSDAGTLSCRYGEDADEYDADECEEDADENGRCDENEDEE